ncbi:MAG: hypothetical protein Q7U04_14070 [Bacteriovorax sp.]|nr:hypothetical protein [Bacteriovorax sp.]
MNFRNHFVYLLIFFLKTGVFNTAFSQTISGNPVGCHNTQGVLTTEKMTGKILLNKNFLPTDLNGIKKIQDEAIEVQIKHLMGLLKNSSTSNLNAALSAYRGELKILETQNLKYGSSFIIDSYLPTSRGNPSSSYTQMALNRGFVKATDDALLIQYQIELLIADCSPLKYNSYDKILLPYDPYLSLWLEDKSKRKPREFGPEKISAISDCSSNEIVLFGNADVSWFFWDPKCQLESSKVYKPDFKLIKKIVSSNVLDKSFFNKNKNKNKKASFSAVFGIVNQSDFFHENKFEKIKSFTFETLNACKNKKIVSECLPLWDGILGAQENNKYYEPGAYNFFLFLKYINTLVKIESIEHLDESKNQNEIILKIKGQLIDSITPVDIAVYFGKTTLDYGPKVSSNYLRFLHNAFSDNDVISYVGHAGLGQNLKMSVLNKLWQQEKLAPISRQTPLWLGIYNCEAFSYFGFDLNTIFKNKFLNVFLTETSGTESGAKFPLAQLSLLNMYHSHQEVRVKDVMGRYVQSREFLTMMNLKDSK